MIEITEETYEGDVAQAFVFELLKELNEPYGHYKDVPDSVCFAKALDPPA